MLQIFSSDFAKYLLLCCKEKKKKFYLNYIRFLQMQDKEFENWHEQIRIELSEKAGGCFIICFGSDWSYLYNPPPPSHPDSLLQVHEIDTIKYLRFFSMPLIQEHSKSFFKSYQREDIQRFKMKHFYNEEESNKKNWVVHFKTFSKDVLISGRVKMNSDS